MRSITLLIGLVAIGNIACKKSNTPTELKTAILTPKSGTQSVPLNDYSLVWQDDFNGTVLDPRWDYRAANTTRTYALILKSNVSLTGNGVLQLAARRVGDSSFTASQLATDQNFLQKYGYFECRAQLDTTEGPHSGFWLQSPTMGATLNPGVDGTEIDIMEHHDAGGIRNRIYHTIHWNGYGANHQSSGTNETIPGIESGYHTFGLEWTPSQYIFYVDGVVKRTVTQSTAPISHRSEFVLLSMEITGFGGNRFAGIYPDFINFDYVKVYKPIKTFVYGDKNFSGSSARLGVGNYTMAQLTALGISNDTLSSISVPDGYKAILYADDNFQGNNITVTGESNDLSSLNFNDNVSSIKIIAN